jgi:NDP-sugar pyrophosphorylase family protein
MNPFVAAEFFDLDGFAHATLFAPDRPVWEALGEPLDTLFAEFPGWQKSPVLPTGVHHLGGPLAIAEGCTIEPGAVLRGPLIVGPGSAIRTGAYVRGGVVLGCRCIVGAHTEIKHAVFLDGARAPHQNYVGDSILGRDVNLGAGTILSNVKNVGSEVSFQHRGESVRTGMRKLGAILGDGCRTGCNTVLNPGVLMGRGCVTYPNVALRSGLYPAGTLVKLRQEQRQIILSRLASD